MLDTLTVDTLTYIFSFLCPVDQTSFRFTCKVANSLPPPNYYSIIFTNLFKHHSNPTQFLTELSKYDAVMSGSFMLHCLFTIRNEVVGEQSEYRDVPYNDIDIFEYIPIIKNVDYPTDNYYCSRAGFECDSFRKYLFDNRTENYTSRSNGPHTQYVRTFDKIFQHIHLPLSPMPYIRRTFDLDICKVVFDGHKLYVRNWMKLIERKDYIRPTSLAIANYCTNNDHKVRIKKYREKGFAIYNHPRHDDMIEYIEGLLNNGNGVQTTMPMIVSGEFDLERFDL